MAGDLIPLPARSNDEANAAPPVRHRARASIRLGKRSRLDARIAVTSGGLLAIGALVSSILLSTAVLVHVAVRDGADARNQR